ncbi:MAG: ABC transporter substrate-binding protein [Endozoicomonas sp.]|uniref:ABC transporter substrate-binding protein n=1 Tax=Endozoicomonas sp. TaxID=1892382 RepID=UPI003D9AEC4E
MLISTTTMASMTEPDLPAIPEKIAALNWTQAEMLLTLGVVPAGVTSIKSYRKWQSDDPVIPEGVTELGQRAEPGLEAIAALKPDLILGYKWRHSRIADELNTIAPTVLYTQYPSQEDPVDYFVRMQGIFRSVALILGREALAEKKLKEMESELQQARSVIKAAGLSGHKVVVGKFVGMGLGLRVYGDSSLAGAIVNKIGLDNSWHSALPGRDFTHVDLLKLTTIGDASLIIIGSQPDNLPDMAQSSVWNALPAVKEGRVYYLPALWSFGGPESAARMATAFASHLAPEA